MTVAPLKPPGTSHPCPCPKGGGFVNLWLFWVVLAWLGRRLAAIGLESWPDLSVSSVRQSQRTIHLIPTSSHTTHTTLTTHTPTHIARPQWMHPLPQDIGCNPAVGPMALSVCTCCAPCWRNKTPRGRATANIPSTCAAALLHCPSNAHATGYTSGRTADPWHQQTFPPYASAGATARAIHARRNY